MILVPIEKIESEAKSDGLQTSLNLEIRPSLSNGYNPFTGRLRLRPYNSRFQCALRLSHEIKHQIDLQQWPAWLTVLVYWPPIIGVGLWVGLATVWYLSIPASIAAYLLHPFELSANLYALQNWKRYYRHLENP
jgi:hypothetical protein